jgi:hypothetical protein
MQILYHIIACLHFMIILHSCFDTLFQCGNLEVYINVTENCTLRLNCKIGYSSSVLACTLLPFPFYWIYSRKWRGSQWSRKVKSSTGTPFLSNCWNNINKKKISESVYKCLQGHAMTSKCILLRFNYLSWSNPPCHCSDLPHLLHPPHYSNWLRLLLVLCILNLYKSYWKYYLKKQCFYYYSPALFGWLTWMQEQKKSCKASLRSREGKWTL